MSGVDADNVYLLAGHHEALGHLTRPEAELLRAAADEIDRLRAEVEELRALLDNVREVWDTEAPMPLVETMDDLLGIGGPAPWRKDGES